MLLNAKNERITDEIYPVGSIYMSVVEKNPTDLFGGTWEQIAQGRTLVGVDTSQAEFNTVKKIGGSKYSEKHFHRIFQHAWKDSGINQKINVATNYSPSGGVAVARLGDNGTTNNNSPSVGNPDVVGEGEYGIIKADWAGTGNSGNLQPYFVCYIWCRTA